MGSWVSKPQPADGSAGTAPQSDPVADEIAELDRWARSKRWRKENTDPIIISDLVCEDPTDPGTTLQWVNMVMAGGGMLGIAHVGFVRVLEQAGVRFLGLGGASAGAINAALIAVVRERPDKTSWESTQKILTSAHFGTFEDGPPYFARLRMNIVKTGLRLKALLLSLFWNHNTVSQAYILMGLHKGDTFLSWLKKVMSDHGGPPHGVKTTNELLDKMKLQAKGIYLYRCKADGQYEPVDMALLEPWLSGDTEQGRYHYPLRLVTSEVATQTMVVFPRDADLFYGVDSLAHPADYVRASMSVPIFFQPFTIPYKDPVSGQQLGEVQDGGLHDSQRWRQRNGFVGNVPAKAVFCDGGTLSNFPIHLFLGDQPTAGNVPLCPTVGVRLGQDRGNLPPVKDAGAYIGSVFDTSRNLLDRQFLFKNPMYADWVATVNTTGYDWLAFDMPNETQQRLLLAGMKAARDFLKSKTKHFANGPPKPVFNATPTPATTAATTSAAAAPAASAAAPVAAKAEADVPEVSHWEAYKLINQLLDAAHKVRTGEFGVVARTVLLQNLKLEEKYNMNVVPAMDVIKAARRLDPEHWAYGVFLPGVDQGLRERLLNARRVTQTFWREVQSAYQPKPNQLQVITKDWWSNNWIGRGREYRLLVEPLDIANFYQSGLHLESGHYIDYQDKDGNILPIGPTVQDEMAVDNKKRPGRYRMLQILEAEAEDQDKFGVNHMTSSLGTARELKEKVGSMTWQQYVSTVAAASHP